MKKEVARERLLCTRTTFSQSLMVSVGISKLGCTDLVFVDPGVKIDGAYYRDVLLSKQLLPVMREVSAEFFVFQQDNAPAHRHVTLCDLFFAVPGLWPANSPDLSPVDYRIWSVVQQRVYQSRVHDTDELKQCVQQVWRNVDQSTIDNAIDEWHACRRTEDTSSI